MFGSTVELHGCVVLGARNSDLILVHLARRVSALTTQRDSFLLSLSFKVIVRAVLHSLEPAVGCTSWTVCGHRFLCEWRVLTESPEVSILLTLPRGRYLFVFLFGNGGLGEEAASHRLAWTVLDIFILN